MDKCPSILPITNKVLVIWSSVRRRSGLETEAIQINTVLQLSSKGPVLPGRNDAEIGLAKHGAA